MHIGTDGQVDWYLYSLTARREQLRIDVFARARLYVRAQGFYAPTDGLCDIAFRCTHSDIQSHAQSSPCCWRIWNQICLTVGAHKFVLQKKHQNHSVHVGTRKFYFMHFSLTKTNNCTRIVISSKIFVLIGVSLC